MEEPEISEEQKRLARESYLAEAAALPYPMNLAVGIARDATSGLSEEARALLTTLIYHARRFGQGPYPDAGFKGREEANALALYCFRHTHLENLHADKLPVTQDEMKTVMLEATLKTKAWLELRDFFSTRDPKAYLILVQAYRLRFARDWTV